MLVSPGDGGAAHSARLGRRGAPDAAGGQQEGRDPARPGTLQRSEQRNENRALCERGNFTRITAMLRDSGEGLARELGITKGRQVLDLDCGDGTTAMPIAHLGAEMLGVDMARNLLEAGNRRAREAGLTDCRFREGDFGARTGLPDASFDRVAGLFDAMFAPQRDSVAREMVRVTGPGDRKGPRGDGRLNSERRDAIRQLRRTVIHPLPFVGGSE